MNMRDREPLTQEEHDLAQKLSRLDAHAGPSSALDAAILAAARGDAGANLGGTAPAPRGRRRPRWPFGLGIAASLAVAVGVAWQLRPQPETQVLSAPAEADLRAYSIVEPATAAIDPVEQAPAEAAVDRVADAAPTPTRALSPPQAAERGQREAAAKAERRTDTAREEAPAPGTTSPVAPQAAVDAPPPRESAAKAKLAESADIVFDAVPPPPPAPPAPAVAASTEPVFVPSPPAISGGAAARALRTDDAASQRERMQSATPAPAAHRDPARSVAVPAAPVAIGARVEPAQEIDTLADQPLDDRPPASADSPQVRDAWLQRIRELRDTGALDEARASLREFVRRHPQAAVPDDLRPLLGE